MPPTRQSFAGDLIFVFVVPRPIARLSLSRGREANCTRSTAIREGCDVPQRHHWRQGLKLRRTQHTTKATSAANAAILPKRDTICAAWRHGRGGPISRESGVVSHVISPRDLQSSPCASRDNNDPPPHPSPTRGEGSRSSLRHGDSTSQKEAHQFVAKCRIRWITGSSLPGLTRRSILFAKSFYEADGWPGQAWP